MSIPPHAPLDRPLVALCITGLEPGGAERCAARLAMGLRETHFRTTVYSLMPRPAVGYSQLEGALEEAGVPLHFLGAHSLASTWRVLGALTRRLKIDQPRVLQTFLFHANLLGRLAARRARIEHVISGIRVAERRRGIRLWLERRTESMVDRHVCVSRAVAEFSRTRGGLSPQKLVVIPNGVDALLFDRTHPVSADDLGLPAGGRWIVYVGRLDPQKCVDRLLRMAARFLPELPHHRLLILGEGPDRLHLEADAARRGLSERVHFLGWRPDVPSVLRASQVLVLPSAWEGMPNAILEAMAAGLPVVSFEVEGVAELLGPNHLGQVVPRGDEDSFSAAVARFAANDQEARRAGEQNRLRARKEFSVQAMVDQYGRLYDELLALP
jgi:glycosyltransferase involved in cell wall biosynthesis